MVYALTHKKKKQERERKISAESSSMQDMRGIKILQQPFGDSPGADISGKTLLKRDYSSQSRAFAKMTRH